MRLIARQLLGLACCGLALYAILCWWGFWEEAPCPEPDGMADMIRFVNTVTSSLAALFVIGLWIQFVNASDGYDNRRGRHTG